MYDNEGNISSVTKDASGLFPAELNILEVEKVEENFDQFKYRIVDGKNPDDDLYRKHDYIEVVVHCSMSSGALFCFLLIAFRLPFLRLR